MALEIGQKILPWNLEAVDSLPAKSPDEYQGQFLLILFFYLGCPGCIGRAIPYANRVVLENQGKIQVVGIHSNFEGPEFSDEKILAANKEFFVRFPVYRDAGLATTFYDYGAAGTPHWILVDKKSKVVTSIFGSDPNRALLRLDYYIKELTHEG